MGVHLVTQLSHVQPAASLLWRGFLMDGILGFCVEKIIAPIAIIGLTAILVIAVPVGIYAAIQDSKRPTFDLKKDDWECLQEHKTFTTTYVLVGKVMVPQTISHTECVQWGKK